MRNIDISRQRSRAPDGPGSAPDKRHDGGIYRARAPLRLGLAGGGTDLSPYSDIHGGATLNVTIDRFALASLAKRQDGVVILRANDLDVEERHSAGPLLIDHGLVLHRAVYNRISTQFLDGYRVGMEVSTAIEAPPGSGLGSSSALVVALVEVFREAFSLPLGLYDVARIAFEIERLELGLAGGKQDQYAAAFGGVNFIEFLADERVVVNPLRVAPAIMNELQCSIVVCFSGQSRDSDAIIHDQIRAVAEDGAALEALHALKRDAVDMKQALLRGDISEMARILDRSWASKKATALSVSNPFIEKLYAVARANGARAGKISGAGGGGFMMFIVDPEHKMRLVRQLQNAGGTPDKVVFTHQGVEAWSVPN
jgi:D-glycero-alpha-D-manno-heptose-7-phosphate kinase